MERWQKNIEEFMELAERHDVKMLMVGGGAVQFHGYNRNSFDIDFWIKPSSENFDKLLLVFKDMGYEIIDFPNAVREQKQNISIKFAPLDLDLELITNFSVDKSFDEAYANAQILKSNITKAKSRVLSLEDLIISKVKAGRPKDLLDIQELQKIHKLDLSKGVEKSKNKGRGLSM